MIYSRVRTLLLQSIVHHPLQEIIVSSLSLSLSFFPLSFSPSCFQGLEFLLNRGASGGIEDLPYLKDLSILFRAQDQSNDDILTWIEVFQTREKGERSVCG